MTGTEARALAIGDELLPIDEVISAGYRASDGHLKAIEELPPGYYNKTPKEWREYNLYWAKVHYSASKYLEEAKNE